MIRNMDELYEILKEIIDKECVNKDFKNYLRDKFGGKGFNASIPNQILGESISLLDAQDNHLICFTEGCKEYFSLSDLKLEEYFGKDKLANYATFINAEIIPEFIEVENVTRDPLNENRFIANFVPLEKFAIWEKYNLTRYNYETQRDAKLKKLSNDKVIKRKNVNETSVEEITDMMYNDRFQPNMITYNMLLVEGKKQNYVYNEKERKLIIKPNFNYSDEDFTVVDIVDGQHRTTGATRAVARANKNGIELKGSLHACFYMMTVDEAKEYIETQSKQNAIPKEYTESLQTNSHTKFIDNIIDYKTGKENIFKGNVSNTFDEMEIYNKLTYKTLLVDALKMTRVDVDDMVEKRYTSEKIAIIITTLIKYMCKEFYENNVSKMKSEEIFLTPNIFIGYIALAEQLKKYNEKDYIDKLIDIALTLQDKDVKERLLKFKLNSKSIDASKRNIFNYFKKLVETLDIKEEVAVE